MEENWTYKKAGVDLDAGYEAVRRIKPFADRTRIPGVLSGLDGFGGCFALPAGYAEPVLISGTDGVGTKLKIAYASGVHNTVGIDCVAMCVNDIVCQGAKPLFFLDYIGTGKLDPPQAATVVEGVSEGCLQAGCALIGGETAELPGIYQPGEYDLVGFAVGVAEKSKIITGQSVEAGDVLVGVASSGLHSNGFSLARTVALADGRTLDTYVPELSDTLAQVMLTPTKIYARLMQAVLDKVPVKGVAHITGGGWIENIPRLAGGRTDVAMRLNPKSAPVPPIFSMLQQWGHIKTDVMYNTFNMGIGLVIAAAPAQADALVSCVREIGDAAYLIGVVEERAPGEEPVAFV